MTQRQIAIVTGASTGDTAAKLIAFQVEAAKT
jgi:hypothetical protein